MFQVTVLFTMATALAAGDSPNQLAVWFAAGEKALQRGDLAAAEKAFQDVLAKAPGNGGAHANLGVVYMRRRQWQQALGELQRARELDPGTPGIRLNIGLTHFREGDYASAIPAFQSVVRDQPAQEQALYLLGLCYFLVDRYQECIGVLAPLWAASSTDLNYLYVLMVAAGKTGQDDLARKASERLLQEGNDSAELRLFWGMALLARDQDSKALEQFQEAARQEPELRFLHYYLGLTYKRQHKLEDARREFLKDRDLEPDVAYNYDELGTVCAALEEFEPAKKYFQEALKRDASLGTSWFGLAKIYRREKLYSDALAAVTKVERVDPNSPSVHYLKGQTLIALGRRAEARKELDTARELQQQVQDNLQRAISGTKYRDLQVSGEK